MAKEKKSESKKKSNKILLAFITSIISCFVGYYLVKYIFQTGLSILPQGTDAIIIIGPCCGFACLIFMRVRNNLFGLWCFVIALIFTVFAEIFIIRPKTESLNYFFAHLKDLDPKVLVSMIIGPIIAFYFGRGPKEK